MAVDQVAEEQARDRVRIGAGPDHVNFKLSKSGESIALFSPDGTLITGVTFDAQQTGVSQGHFPDGSTNLVSFTTTVSPGLGLQISRNPK